MFVYAVHSALNVLEFSVELDLGTSVVECTLEHELMNEQYLLIRI